MNCMTSYSYIMVYGLMALIVILGDMVNMANVAWLFLQQIDVDAYMQTDSAWMDNKFVHIMSIL